MRENTQTRLSLKISPEVPESEMERLGDGVDMVARHDLTDGLGTAKDPRLFRLFHEGI